MPPKKNPHSNPTRNALMLFNLLLFSGRSYSLKRLAEILDCSRQSVLRLMEQIEGCGYGNIQKSTQHGQNHYQLFTHGTRPRPNLTPEELERLVCCREWLRHMLPEGVLHMVEQATEKSATLLDDYEARRVALQPVGGSVVKGGINYTPYEDVLDCLIRAIRNRQVLEVLYQSLQRSEPRIHELVPLRLVSFHEGLYVRGVKVTEMGTPQITKPITLAVHRIQQVTPTRRVLPEDTVIPEVEETGHFGVSQQCVPFIVRARFYGKAQVYVSERVWGQEQAVTPDADGLYISFTAQSEMEVVKWILGFGADAQLLEPAHLCEQVVHELQTALFRYGTCGSDSL